MHTFRTPLPLLNYNFDIRHDDPILLLGSCFAENIGTKLSYHKHTVVCNPFGIIFNSHSIDRLIERVVQGQSFSEEEIEEHEGRHFNWLVHGRLNAQTRARSLSQCNDAFEITRTALKECRYVFITLGTAWVYTLKSTGQIVANCHKVPNDQFEKKLLSPPEIHRSLEGIMQNILSINPDARIILTLSPVRHLRDGIIENQRSKSLLHATIQEITASHKHVSYFPSYELLLDDLRDYRFYARDMIHPSDEAIDYIWEYFKKVFFREETLHLVNRVADIQQKLHHRPSLPDSAQHRSFLHKTLHQVEIIQREYDYMDWGEELLAVQKAIEE